MDYCSILMASLDWFDWAIYGSGAALFGVSGFLAYRAKRLYNAAHAEQVKALKTHQQALLVKKEYEALLKAETK